MRTQAEAALVLVHIVVNASEPVNDVNGVVRGLLDVCQSEHPTVRNRAVHICIRSIEGILFIEKDG